MDNCELGDLLTPKLALLTLNSSFYVRFGNLKIYTSRQLPPDLVGHISLFYNPLLARGILFC